MDCVLDVDLECPKQLLELQNDKTEIKRDMLSKYQLMISDFYNILIGNVKNLVPEFFDNKQYALHYENFI